MCLEIRPIHLSLGFVSKPSITYLVITFKVEESKNTRKVLLLI